MKYLLALMLATACTPAQLARAKADSKAALDKACEVRALEKISEPDAGAK